MNNTFDEKNIEVLNHYGIDINGFTENWWYFSEGLNSIRRHHPNLFVDIMKKKGRDYDRTKIIIQHLAYKIGEKILGVEQKITKKYLYELEKYVPLAFSEKIWYRPEEWILLYLVYRIMKPDVVISTGCQFGWSTFFECMAIELNNKPCDFYVMDILDIDEELNEQDSEWFKQGYAETELGISKCKKLDKSRTLEVLPEKFFKYITFISGDTKKTLPELLKRLHTVDCFFHDSLHTYDHMKFEYEEVFHYIKKGGIIISHDIKGNKDVWEDFLNRYKVDSYYSGYNIGLCKK